MRQRSHHRLSNMRYEVALWAEFTHPLKVVKSIGMTLARERVKVIVAISREDLNDDFARGLRGLESTGVKYGLWPLLSDEEGYWPSIVNISKFRRVLESILRWLSKQDLEPTLIAFDFEPPLQLVRNPSPRAVLSYVRLVRRALSPAKVVSMRCLELVEENGIRPVCVIPDTVFEFPDHETTLAILGLPVDLDQWPEVNVMTYTTLASGWYGITLEAARWRMLRILRRARGVLHGRLSASVGLTWTGKMGNEPTYRSPRELSQDIGLALSVGVRRIYVYSLEGLINRPRSEMHKWLTAMKTPERPSIALDLTYELRSRLISIAVKLLRLMKSLIFPSTA